MRYAIKLVPICSLLSLIVATGCDDGHHTTTTDPSTVTVPGGGAGHPSGGNDEPGPYDDEVELVIRNNTSRVIYKLYASPSAVDSWGPDLLKGNSIGPGASRTFSSRYCDDYYDLKAVDVSGNTIGRAWELYFACGTRHQVTVY